MLYSRNCLGNSLMWTQVSLRFLFVSGTFTCLPSCVRAGKVIHYVLACGSLRHAVFNISCIWTRHVARMEKRGVPEMLTGCSWKLVTWEMSEMG
jgi:hypothetical protein